MYKCIILSLSLFIKALLATEVADLQVKFKKNEYAKVIKCHEEQFVNKIVRIIGTVKEADNNHSIGLYKALGLPKVGIIYYAAVENYPYCFHET